jgi:hypothetical protein
MAAERAFSSEILLRPLRSAKTACCISSMKLMPGRDFHLEICSKIAAENDSRRCCIAGEC